MIRIAEMKDLAPIMAIVEDVKSEMHAYGNYQWDETYPRTEDFEKDILDRSLYIYDEDGMLAGFLCMNTEEPMEYGDADWSMDKEALVLHRLAVNPAFRGQGVGRLLIQHADVICAESGLAYLKTDTNQLNAKAQQLLAKCGFTFAGDVGLAGHEGRFYCYEKKL